LTRYQLSALLFFIAAFANAQQHRLGGWGELAVTHDLNKKWSVGGDVLLRKYPAAYNSQYIAEAGVSRELAKRLKASAGYRFTVKDIGFEQRLQFDLAYQLRFKKFQLTDRVRYQYEWYNTQRDANYLRNKATLKYRGLKKVTPLAAAEVFYRADYGYRFADQLRYFIGADYSLNKHLELSLQWVRTQEIQVVRPVTSDVAYVGLTYDIRKAKKKK
jgi:hypothetical protein